MGDRKLSQFQGTSPRTCRTTFCAASGPVGYPLTFKPLSPASLSLSWTPRPAMQIASTTPSPRLRSLALANQSIQSFCSASRNSLAWWRLSKLSRTVSAPKTVAPAPESLTTAPAIDRPTDMMLQTTSSRYHQRSGDREQYCTQPCTYSQQGN
jgi:hypothetical protein